MLIFGRKCSTPLRPIKWVTLWWFLFGVHPYQPTLDFAFFILEWTIKRIDVISKKKGLPNDSGRHHISYNHFTDKKKKQQQTNKNKTKWLLLRSSVFFKFSVLNWVVIQSPGFTNDYKFSVSVDRYHSNLNFTHHFDIYWLLQNGTKKNQHQ